MNSLPWCLAGLLFCFVSAPVARASTLEERVNLEARGVTLRAALRLLTKGTDTTIRVDPQVPDTEVRLTLKGVTIDHALRLIVRQVSRQAPALTYEAAREGFRVFLDASAPDPPTVEDANKFTITRAVRAPEVPAEPVANPAPDPDPGATSAGDQDPPRIDPTPAQYSLTFDPGTASYSYFRPPGSKVYNDKMPVGGAGKLMLNWGASAYTWLGPSEKPWLRIEAGPQLHIEPIREYYRPLSPVRRYPPTKRNQGGGDAGGSNNNNGGGNGPGGFGRRPL